MVSCFDPLNTRSSKLPPSPSVSLRLPPTPSVYNSSKFTPQPPSKADAFKLFNKDAFVFYDIKDPQGALDRIAHLEANRTAYADVVARPILADGQRTLEEYFSLSDRIGGGKLKRRVLRMLFGQS